MIVDKPAISFFFFLCKKRKTKKKSLERKQCYFPKIQKTKARVKTDNNIRVRSVGVIWIKISHLRQLGSWYVKKMD